MNDHELLTAVRQFRQELSDWFSSQEATTPDTDWGALSEKGPEALIGSGGASHMFEFQQTYRERFAPRAIQLVAAIKLAGLRLPARAEQWGLGTNPIGVRHVVTDFDQIIEQLKARTRE